MSTDLAAILGSLEMGGDPQHRRQGPKRKMGPVVVRQASTTLKVPHEEEPTLGQRISFETPAAEVELPYEVSATPLQIWEGVVEAVDQEKGVMQVYLDAKMSAMPRHTAEIELEWVSDQDADLVSPGAVFYLTLFKRTKPSVENSQELRFRRRPSWSLQQLRQMESDADMIASKLQPLPKAE